MSERSQQRSGLKGDGYRRVDTTRSLHRTADCTYCLNPATHLTNFDRMDKLMELLMIAAVWCLLVGTGVMGMQINCRGTSITVQPRACLD
ncbi:MAG: hypothetical protein QS721_05950 [Candidatus Endonucleobacter sp. (ex Gigantidas childressi)]|nr:hypothetical protein [Candidatus Endonucleobacter sp. (ex Gigantidas childressi)]